MNKQDFLTNVYQISVPCGYEEEFVCFQKKLEKALEENYCEYFISRQVYENDDIGNSFVVVAFLKNIHGVREASAEITEFTMKFYKKYWCAPFKRTVINDITSSTRILPPEAHKDCTCAD